MSDFLALLPGGNRSVRIVVQFFGQTEVLCVAHCHDAG